MFLLVEEEIESLGYLGNRLTFPTSFECIHRSVGYFKLHA